jgi:hypothetical protein
MTPRAGPEPGQQAGRRIRTLVIHIVTHSLRRNVATWRAGCCLLYRWAWLAREGRGPHLGGSVRQCDRREVIVPAFPEDPRQLEVVKQQRNLFPRGMRLIQKGPWDVQGTGTHNVRSADSEQGVAPVHSGRPARRTGKRLQQVVRDGVEFMLRPNLIGTLHRVSSLAAFPAFPGGWV